MVAGVSGTKFLLCKILGMALHSHTPVHVCTYFHLSLECKYVPLRDNGRPLDRRYILTTCVCELECRVASDLFCIYFYRCDIVANNIIAKFFMRRAFCVLVLNSLLQCVYMGHSGIQIAHVVGKRQELY